MKGHNHIVTKILSSEVEAESVANVYIWKIVSFLSLPQKELGPTLHPKEKLTQSGPKT